MRISDWSSDVCSSDLRGARLGGVHFRDMRRGEQYLVAAPGRIFAEIIDGRAFAAPDRAFALDFGDDDVDMRLGAATDDELTGDRPAFDARAFQLDSHAGTVMIIRWPANPFPNASATWVTGSRSRHTPPGSPRATRACHGSRAFWRSRSPPMRCRRST